MPLQGDAKTGRYSLVLRKMEKPAYDWIENSLIPLFTAALKSGGTYQGWDFTSR
jgi:hypothetical protein